MSLPTSPRTARRLARALAATSALAAAATPALAAPAAPATGAAPADSVQLAGSPFPRSRLAPSPTVPPGGPHVSYTPMAAPSAEALGGRVVRVGTGATATQSIAIPRTRCSWPAAPFRAVAWPPRRPCRPAART